MTAQNSTTASLKRTPLYEQHRAMGARLVEFSGWEMPVQYSSILEEHEAVRTRAGLFDVSHMGEFKVEGAGALPFLQYLVPNDVSRLSIGQALYTQLCLPDGNTIDDLIISHLADEHYMLVVNAGNIEKAFAWVEKQSKNFKDVHVINQSDTTALLPLQEQGARRKRMGTRVRERGVARCGYAIYENDQPIGVRTSGAPGPSVHKQIGMGYVDAAHAEVGKNVQIDIRGRRTAAQIVSLPFYKRNR